MRTHIGETLIGIISSNLDERNQKGFEEYKETLDDVPYENYDWNQMVIEEVLDGMQYLIKENMRLRALLKDGENRMLFKDFQELSKRTMPLALPDKWNKPSYSAMDKSNYALGLCGEAGEVGELVKKNVHHNHKLNRDKMVKEIGDVLHYLSGVATMYGITLEEAATMNLIKLQERYPKGFSSEDSIKRVDLKTQDINSLYPASFGINNYNITSKEVQDKYKKAEEFSETINDEETCNGLDQFFDEEV